MSHAGKKLIVPSCQISGYLPTYLRARSSSRLSTTFPLDISNEYSQDQTVRQISYYDSYVERVSMSGPARKKTSLHCLELCGGILSTRVRISYILQMLTPAFSNGHNETPQIFKQTVQMILPTQQGRTIWILFISLYSTTETIRSKHGLFFGSISTQPMRHILITCFTQAFSQNVPTYTVGLSWAVLASKWHCLINKVHTCTWHVFCNHFRYLLPSFM